MGGGWLTPSAAPFTPQGTRIGTYLTGGCVGLWAWLDGYRNPRPPTGIGNPDHVTPTSRYKYYALPAAKA